MTDTPIYLLRNRRQVGADSVGGMGMPPVPSINIGGNAFTLIDAAGSEVPWVTMGPIFTVWNEQARQWVPRENTPHGAYLDAVLVDVNPVMSKAFWGSAYNPNAERFVPPICWSDNGIAPSTNAMKPQRATCDTCPNDVWGSAVNNLGSKVKACEDIRKMAWIVPELWAKGMQTVFLLRMKGGSFKNWRTYAETINRNRIGDRAMDPTDLVTRIYFDPESNFGVLKFTAVSLIDEAMAKAQDQIWESKGTDNLVGKNDRPIQGLPAPGAQSTQGPEPGLAPPPSTNVVPGPGFQLAAPPPRPPVNPANTLNQPVPQEAPQPRRRGRPKAAATPAQTPQNVPQHQPVPPPGPPGTSPQAAPFAPPPPPQAPTQFGMRAPAPPTPEVAEAIAHSLNLPNVPPPR